MFFRKQKYFMHTPTENLPVEYSDASVIKVNCGPRLAVWADFMVKNEISISTMLLSRVKH